MVNIFQPIRETKMKPKLMTYSNKTIYVKDVEKWNEAIKFAKAQDLSMSDVIAMALEKLLNDPGKDSEKLLRIRAIIEE